MEGGNDVGGDIDGGEDKGMIVEVGGGGEGDDVKGEKG